MNIVFLGYMVPIEKMNQYSGISVAGNKMQYNIISELNKLPDVTVHSVSISPYACYPNDKRVFVKKKQYDCKGVACYQIPYCNLPIIKQLTQIHIAYKQVKKIVKKLKEKNEKVIVMGFNMFPQVGIPMKKIRKYAETVCVLADLPIDDYTNRKGFSKWLRKRFDSNTKKNMDACDNYIVLSKHVGKDFLPDKKVIVVEGGINDEDILENSCAKKRNEKMTLVFGGALTEYNGIKNLVGAMQHLKKQDVELRIYGDGYLKDYVIDAQNKDARIQYWGRVSNEEMKKCQREADVLINPRQVDNIISKYTFPSKTFEYFLSRTIVISTRIPSYPKDYLDKMILAEDTSDGLAVAITKVFNMSFEEKETIEEKAYRFVVDEKKWSNQIVKIYDFIETIFEA